VQLLQGRRSQRSEWKPKPRFDAEAALASLIADFCNKIGTTRSSLPLEIRSADRGITDALGVGS
jgi:hypothetical protein